MSLACIINKRIDSVPDSRVNTKVCMCEDRKSEHVAIMCMGNMGNARALTCVSISSANDHALLATQFSQICIYTFFGKN